MSYKTQPAQNWEKLTTFASDNEVNVRAAYPEGGTQFVYVGANNEERTVLAADYDTWARYPVEVKTIKAATDCTAVHIFG